MTWRLVAHTADVAIEADAADHGAALADAATALTSVMTGLDDPRAIPPTEERSLAVEAPDAGSLLVAWLSELAWLAESEDALWLGGGCEVTQTHDGLRVDATGNFGRFDPGQHLGLEVKAVTYHELRSERRGDAWSMRVVLDL